MNGKIKVGLVLAAIVLGAAPAAAQDPELGDTGGGGGATWGNPQPQPQQQWGAPQQQGGGGQQWGGGQQQQQQQQQPPAQGWGGDTEQPPTGGGGDPDAAAGQDDHEAVVGHIGVGWFGLQSVPYPGSVAPAAATVGLRYWLGESLGLDLALGFGMISGTHSEDLDGDVMSNDTPSAITVVVHGGLPLVLYHAQHYKFLFIPQLDIGIADGDDGGDTLFSGFIFQVGAEVGAEIHFGFMDVPQLSLQGTIGLGLAYVSTSTNSCVAAPPDECDSELIVSDSGFGIATAQFNEPWDILTSQVRAIYYF